MVFSSFTFLLIFLPFTVLINFLLPKKASNVFLLITSLIFYYYGEKQLTILLICSIIWNYLFVHLINNEQIKNKSTKKPLLYLTLCVIGNLALLFYYKYFTFFIQIVGLEAYFPASKLANIVMPIGISFFTFHGLSYVVDVYRKQANATKNIIDLGLYIAFFPQLIAGPIIKYHDIEKEIKDRKLILSDVHEGINRFIRGLAKKIILANNFALVADSIFKDDITNLSSPAAWVGIICYTLQIYFDFSGYSDMAIGLAKMMGFHFKENFNYPYIAQSIQDFWRRWHISLSTWFKEYVYIPLGGNRKGNSRMLFNLLIVFILTGLWHGASYNFLIWGLIHGTFIILEKIPFPSLPKIFRFLKHFYVLSVVGIAWVFFRTDDLLSSLWFINKLISMDMKGTYYFLTFLSPYFLFISLIGIALVMPVRSKLTTRFQQVVKSNKGIQFAISSGFHLLLFVFTLLELSSLNYNPFIYFRF